MTGERNLIRAGYRWHIFAYFSCNKPTGVRVAVRKTKRGAERFMVEFASRNDVEVSAKLRRDGL